MNRRDALGFLTGGVALTLLPRTARAQAAGRKPNVVLVMTDDQGYGDLGCHGNDLMATPNLDSLHAQSVRFTNFHVDPTCSPTRSALMTGRYSSRTGVWHTIMGRSLLRRDEVTVADVFAAAGYATGMFGKWHLGDNYPFRPEDRGFQQVLRHGGGGVGQAPDFWGNDYFDDTYWHNGVPTPFKGYCTDVFFDGALKFIEANKGKPFFAYIPTNAPHGPYRVAEKYAAIYKTKGVKGGRANFWGMITNIDENMGRLLARLKALGLERNTIVIFMTDNGTSAGSSAGLRGRKGSEYEGGHRVPFFIRWPDKVGKPRDIHHLAAHVDVLPTLIDLCGLRTPDKVAFDGASLGPVLAGKSEWPDRTLFVHSQRIEHPQKWRKSAVMTQRWRLVNGKELYDLQADPAQTRNAAAEHPDVVKELTESYNGWWESLSTRFGEYCRIVLGNDADNPTRLSSHDWHTPNVPWHQGAVRNTKSYLNGPWAVEIERAGRYEFTLCQMAAEAKFPIQADQARVKIGDVEKTAPVPQGAAGVTITLGLEPGKAMLQTWLTDTKKNKSRGAYYVYVKRL